MLSGLNALGRFQSFSFKREKKIKQKNICDLLFAFLDTKPTNGTTQKGENLLPLGANSHLLE